MDTFLPEWLPLKKNSKSSAIRSYSQASVMLFINDITENFKLTRQGLGPGNALLRGEVSLNQV